VPGDERRDQRQQAVEVGGQIDVHVRDDRRVTLQPRVPDGAASAFRCEARGANPGQLKGQPLGDGPGRIGARVVDDGDPRIERKSLAEVLPQPANAPLEVALLVVDRDRDVDERGDDRRRRENREVVRHVTRTAC
jgi:hypothetical protein